MKQSSRLWYFGFGLAVISAVTSLFYTFFYLRWMLAPYIVCLVMLGLESAGLFVLLLISKGRSKKRIIMVSALGGLVVAGVACGLPIFIDRVIYFGQGAKHAAIATSVYGAIVALYGVVRLKIMTKEKWVWRPIVAGVLSLLILVGILVPVVPAILAYNHRKSGRKEPIPIGLATYTKDSTSLVSDADLYVSPDGNDENDGSFSTPLATIERARELVREMDKTNKNGITVAIKAGEYSVKQISFTSEDGGTASCPVRYCAYGDGEVIISGGKTLDPSSFSSVTDPSVLARLPLEVRDKVVCTDLTALGLNDLDWGKLYPVGGYGTAKQYDGDTTGPSPCALYFNGDPLTTARYPNEGFLTVQSIVREGEGEESSTSNHAKREGWKSLRNPQTTIFTVDQLTADRIHSYASLDTVWLWTALMYNWADTTVPLKSFDYASRMVEPAYVSVYGAVPGSTYYIFNVIEELDSPGEWYLDRKTGMLYMYPPEDVENARITLSLSTEDVVTVTNADHICFEGLSVRGTRKNCFTLKGNNLTVRDCFVSEVSGIGISIDGYRNTVVGCELAHIGAAAVDLSGGDRPTLTPGESRVINCLIHDYSEVALTAGPGVNLNGVGNVCAHNEFYNSPQQAVFYTGNDMLVEYNLIHNVALLSDDCSAIYSGRRWDCGGCIVRYNILYDLGDDDHSPNGIYWDDGLSGQTAYGNFIINCKGNGFLIGGGRNNVVVGNVLLNCQVPISYDDRSRDGVINPGSWFEHSREGADMQTNLLAVPWQTSTWREVYPYTVEWSLDYSDTENADFIPNPAGSRICGNLIVSYMHSIGEIAHSTYRFSDVSDNAVYTFGQLEKIFVDPKKGDYRLKDDSLVYKKLPDFTSLPFEMIGRTSD